MNIPTQNLTIHHDSKKWSTEIEGEIGEILVDGKRISDVHDLTQKVVGMTRTIRRLAYTATALAVMAVTTVLFLANWLCSHEASIEQLLLTGNDEYNEMNDQARKWRSHQRHRAWVHLKEFHGLHWDDGMQDWVNHAIVKHNRATDRQQGSRSKQ
jgi:hypothetical protein